MSNRRDFIRNMAVVSGAAIMSGCQQPQPSSEPQHLDGKDLIIRDNGLKITGTFLDEISHDIPHQNWGAKEWDRDFQYMKAIGIDTVIMIRSGYRKFITYPSKYLISQGCYMPSVDLLELFLRLADKYDMQFYFGLYDSGHYWDTGDMSMEVERNKYVIEEVWNDYGTRHKSFGGWYISTEISRNTKGAVQTFYDMGKQCKEVSGVEQHEREWDEIFDGIHEVVDACAFQDGHIDYNELDAFFTVNKKLADRYGMQCWTNAESFDRDMPIKFFPIKFDKLRLKLEAAKRCGYDKAITFEFSHFMSPQSAYLQAGHLYDRYREYFGL